MSSPCYNAKIEKGANDGVYVYPFWSVDKCALAKVFLASIIRIRVCIWYC